LESAARYNARMLKALQLGNFKSWREVNAPLAPITGFFGMNSSGKSSLLQALLLMKQSAENSDQKQVLEFGEDTEKHLTQLRSFQETIFFSNLSLSLKFGVIWIDNSTFNDVKIDNEVNFTTKISQFNSFLYIKSQSYTITLDGSKSFFNSPNFTLNQDNSKIIEEIRSASRKFHRILISSIAETLGFQKKSTSIELSLEIALKNIQYLGPLRDSPKHTYSWSGAAPSNVGKQGENTIAALLAARVGGNKVGDIPLENYIAQKLKDLGLIDSFRLEELREGTNIFRVLVRRTPESPEVSLTDVGFGVSQVLPVLVLCYYVPEGSTILLEQPELHLHPSVQSGLADIFIDAYQKRGVQIILESHSEHLLRRLQRRIAEEEILPTDVNLYFCSLEKGESKLEALELDEYGNIHNYPKDFFGDRFEEMAAMTEKAIERRAKKALELK
jgi:predicted ATPase